MEGGSRCTSHKKGRDSKSTRCGNAACVEKTVWRASASGRILTGERVGKVGKGHIAIDLKVKEANFVSWNQCFLNLPNDQKSLVILVKKTAGCGGTRL